MKGEKRRTGTNRNAGKKRHDTGAKRSHTIRKATETIIERIDLGTAPASYGEALLSSIMHGHGNSVKVSAQVFALTGALASMTPKLREVYFSHGFAVGKSLYRHVSGRTNGGAQTLVPMLVEFFEKAGHTGVSYRQAGSSYEFMMHDTPRIGLGMHMHMFEAGVISGFMSSEYRRAARFTETECRADGAESCAFAEMAQESNGIKFDARTGTDAIADYVLAALDSSNIAGEMRYEYYALASDSLMHSEYSSNINDIAYAIGSGLGSRFREENATRSASAGVARLKRLIALLNFGNITIKRTAPMSLRLEFDRLMGNKGIVDLSSNFISGMLNAYLGSKLTSVQRSSLGGYTMNIKEAKTASKRRSRRRSRNR